MNDEICEIVISQKGQDKINVRGYLMVKRSVRKMTSTIGVVRREKS